MVLAIDRPKFYLVIAWNDDPTRRWVHIHSRVLREHFWWIGPLYIYYRAR